MVTKETGVVGVVKVVTKVTGMEDITNNNKAEDISIREINKKVDMMDMEEEVTGGEVADNINDRIVAVVSTNDRIAVVVSTNDRTVDNNIIIHDRLFMIRMINYYSAFLMIDFY